MPWYIDALDPRAGVVFATKRSADLDSTSCLSTADVGPTFFIGPPSFIPEYVERSAGFAMARGQGQVGLFVNDQELPFGSLAEISEFTRRMYLGGAAGDGPGENGVPPPTEGPGGNDTPPPEARPEDRQLPGLAPLPERQSADPVDALLTLADGMRDESARLTDAWPTLMARLHDNPNDSSIQLSSPAPSLPRLQRDPYQTSAARRLVRGALCVLRELYDQRPAPTTDQAWHLLWLSSLHRFAAIATRMGLWSPMRRELRSTGAFEGWMNVLDAGAPEEEFATVLDMLLFGGPLNWSRWGWPLPVASAATDPFEDLARLPTPLHINPFAQPGGHNLQSLLSAAIAMPHQLFNHTSRKEECAELVLFAAANLNLGDESLPLWTTQDDINDYFVQQLADRAYAWIAQNLPKFVYAQQVEDLIKNAADISA